MTTRRKTLLVPALVISAVVLAAAACEQTDAAAGGAFVIPENREDAVLRFLEPMRLGARLVGDYSLDRVSIDGGIIHLVFEDGKRSVATIDLLHPTDRANVSVVGGVKVRPEPGAPDSVTEAVRRALDRAMVPPSPWVEIHAGRGHASAEPEAVARPISNDGSGLAPGAAHQAPAEAGALSRAVGGAVSFLEALFEPLRTLLLAALVGAIGVGVWSRRRISVAGGVAESPGLEPEILAGPRRARFRPRRLGAVLVAVVRSRTSAASTMLAGTGGTVLFWSAGIAITGAAACIHFGLPVRHALQGGDIERLYRTVAWTPFEHLLHPSDYHHPGLWFALLYWPFRWSGHSVAVAGSLGRACAVLAVPVAGAIVAREAGRLASLATMLCVALMPLLMIQSQELSDETLFVLLALTTLWAYLGCVRNQTLLRRVALAFSLGLALQASYAAIVLAGALTFDAVVGRRRRLWAPLSIALVSGVGRFWHILSAIPNELSARKEAAALPWRTWAVEPFGPFMVRAGREYFTGAFPSLLLIVAIGLGWRRLRAHAVLTITVAGYAIVLLAQPFIRVRPYYAMLLPVVVLLLVGMLAGPADADEPSRAGGVRRAAALLALLVSSFASAAMLDHEWSRYREEATRENPSTALIRASLDEGARMLIVNMGQDWTLSTWDFFADPYTAMARCFRDTEHFCDLDDLHEPGSSRRIVALADAVKTRAPDWEDRSVARLEESLRGSDAYLLLDGAFPSTQVEKFASSHCVRRSSAAAFALWRCPRM